MQILNVSASDSGISEEQTSSESDSHEIAVKICENPQELGPKASISACSSSSSSSHSTLSVNDSQEVEQRDEELEQKRGNEFQRCPPRNLLKISKRVTGKAVRSRSYRTPYESPRTVSSKRRLFESPTSDEIEAFLADSENNFHLKNFIDRYNFDVVNEVPLPGRYEWVKVQE